MGYREPCLCGALDCPRCYPFSWKENLAELIRGIQLGLGIKLGLLGVILFFISIIIAFASHALTNYWWSLVLLGLGWNFLFIGGTNLLPRSYNENEKFKVQSVNDFLVFGLQALAALSAGWFVFNFSWEVVLLSVIPLLFMQLALLLWWLKKNG